MTQALLMQKLRRVHLYLGCFFAPMLLFFTVSGMWQTLGWNDHSQVLEVLSTIHKNHGLKRGPNLTSPELTLFILAMALAFIFSIMTGIAMAFRFGHGRAAFLALAAGIIIPFVFILLALR
jgi:hypothetical protein